MISVSTERGISHDQAVRILTDAAYAEGEEPRERYACGTPYTYATKSPAGVMAVPETIVVFMPVRRIST